MKAGMALCGSYCGLGFEEHWEYLVEKSPDVLLLSIASQVQRPKLHS